MEKITYKNFVNRVGEASRTDVQQYFLAKDDCGKEFWIETGCFFDRLTVREMRYYLLKIILENGNGSHEVGGVTLVDTIDLQGYYNICADLLERWKRKQKQNKGGKEND